MASVTGVGGVFFKSTDPEALRAWYRTHLGIEPQPWGGTQFFFNRRDKPGVGYTVWSPFKADTTYFAPSTQPFMINLRVDDLEALLESLRAAGVEVIDSRREDGENGKFGYAMDPEGNLLELWEQNDEDPYIPAEVQEPTRANKDLVRAFFSRFGEGDLEGALGFLSDDATWWILGKPEAIPTSGELGKEKLGKLLRRMQGQMKGPMQMTVESVIAEGDRVAVEVSGHAELQNGRVYANQYHFAITVRDGKIATVREYLDTQHVVATWFTP